MPPALIKCLECGKRYYRPCGHVRQVHGLTAREYKEKHGLDVSKGIMTDADREHMAEKTRNNGTIKNLAKGAQYRYAKGQSNPYTRSAQTMRRLKAHWDIVANKKGTPRRVEKIEIACALCGTKKKIYPKAYKENNNYCGITCRNISINNNNKK